MKRRFFKSLQTLDRTLITAYWNDWMPWMEKYMSIYINPPPLQTFSLYTGMFSLMYVYIYIPLQHTYFRIHIYIIG